MLTALSNQISSKYAPLQEALLIWSKAKVTDIELSAMVDSSRLIAVLGNLLLFALVFGMSATVEISSVRTQIRNYRAILTGMLCQFHVLPLLGFLVVRGMQLNHSVGLTLLVVTSSPGGSYSNWYEMHSPPSRVEATCACNLSREFTPLSVSLKPTFTAYLGSARSLMRT